MREFDNNKNKNKNIFFFKLKEKLPLWPHECEESDDDVTKYHTFADCRFFVQYKQILVTPLSSK